MNITVHNRKGIGDMPNPFTITPGISGPAYIDTHYADEITENFKSEYSEKYIYKILGLRGSGKSVTYKKVISDLKEEGNWLVYTVSSGGDNPVQTLLSLLSNEKFINSSIEKTTTSKEGSVDANTILFKGSGKYTTIRESLPNDRFYSDEAALKKMVEAASDNGYKILIGIDDINKTTEMVKLLSIIGDMILDNSKSIYLVCTGLTKNINDFTSEKHLSFFVRSDEILTTSLSIPLIAQKYMEFLKVDKRKAIELAQFTKGYAYAYQALGDICYKLNTTELEMITERFDALMAAQYTLLWETLPGAEQELMDIIANTSSCKSSDVKEKMANPASYDVLRRRLLNKHIITSKERGSIEIVLPRFKEYLDEWVGSFTKKKMAKLSE